MDLLTQGLLGSSMALTVARPDEIKKAGIIGLLAGLAADVDFFIRSDSDPLLNLEFHRHFTHSIFFIPFAALIISIILWPFFYKQLAYSRIFIYSLAGYLLSGFLDACTSYGTRLLWPISEQRISFNIISIIDPVFTLSLLAGVLLTIKTGKSIFSFLFLLVCSAYLTLGWYQHQKVETISSDLSFQRGHSIERLMVKPTLGNLFLWRSIYQFENNYYVDAIRLSPLSGQEKVIPGNSIALFDKNNHDFKIPADSVLQQDINRFSSFTSDYLALHPESPDIIVDVRYSNLANSILPLWAIQINPANPQQHASYQVYRDSSASTRQTFLDMLFNR